MRSLERAHPIVWNGSIVPMIEYVEDEDEERQENIDRCKQY